jgi:hypothetical protein
MRHEKSSWRQDRTSNEARKRRQGRRFPASSRHAIGPKTQGNRSIPTSLPIAGEATVKNVLESAPQGILALGLLALVAVAPARAWAVPVGLGAESAAGEVLPHAVRIDPTDDRTHAYLSRAQEHLAKTREWSAR